MKSELLLQSVRTIAVIAEMLRRESIAMTYWMWTDVNGVRKTVCSLDHDHRQNVIRYLLRNFVTLNDHQQKTLVTFLGYDAILFKTRARASVNWGAYLREISRDGAWGNAAEEYHRIAVEHIDAWAEANREAAKWIKNEALAIDAERTVKERVSSQLSRKDLYPHFININRYHAVGTYADPNLKSKEDDNVNSLNLNAMKKKLNVVIDSLRTNLRTALSDRRFTTKHADSPSKATKNANTMASAAVAALAKLFKLHRAMETDTEILSLQRQHERVEKSIQKLREKREGIAHKLTERRSALREKIKDVTVTVGERQQTLGYGSVCSGSDIFHTAHNVIERMTGQLFGCASHRGHISSGGGLELSLAKVQTHGVSLEAISDPVALTNINATIGECNAAAIEGASVISEMCSDYSEANEKWNKFIRATIEAAGLNKFYKKLTSVGFDDETGADYFRQMAGEYHHVTYDADTDSFVVEASIETEAREVTTGDVKDAAQSVIEDLVDLIDTKL